MNINSKYELLKFLVVHANPKTLRFKDDKHLLDDLLDGQTQSDYTTELKNEGFINVYLGRDFEILPKAISFLNQL